MPHLTRDRPGFAGPAAYGHLEARGTVVLDDPDKALIETMSQKYLGTPYPWHSDTEQRVVVRLTPGKVVFHT